MNNTDYSFISYDGADPKGVRAEVKVVVGKGHVEKMALGDNGRMSNVFFHSEGAKFDVAGWVKVDTPMYEKLKASFESGEPVEYRIESQRKPKVDRTLSFKEITDSDKQSVTRVIVRVDDLWSDEALTDPSEDAPNPRARYSAFGQAQAPGGAQTAQQTLGGGSIGAARVSLSDDLRVAKAFREGIGPIGKVISSLGDSHLPLSEPENMAAVISMARDVNDVCRAVCQRIPGNSTPQTDYEYMMSVRNIMYSLMDVGEIKISSDVVFGDEEARRAFKNATYAVLSGWVKASL